MDHKFNMINFVGVEKAKQEYRKKMSLKIALFMIGLSFVSIIFFLIEVYQ